MAKLFNGMEEFMIVESLKNEKKLSVEKIKEMESEGKRPLFTVAFIERSIDDLIKKVQENTEDYGK
jgi:hypothetical protein